MCMIPEIDFKTFLGIYSSKERSLLDYQYLQFTKLVTKNKVTNLNSLSSTSSATKEHLFQFITMYKHDL